MSDKRRRTRKFKFVGGPLDESIFELDPQSVQYLYREGLRKYVYTRHDFKTKSGAMISEFHYEKK